MEIRIWVDEQKPFLFLPYMFSDSTSSGLILYQQGRATVAPAFVVNHVVSGYPGHRDYTLSVESLNPYLNRQLMEIIYSHPETIDFTRKRTGMFCSFVNWELLYTSENWRIRR